MIPEEDLYVYFYELDTDDLLEEAKNLCDLCVQNLDLLNTEYELRILFEVLQDRRDEIDMMVEEMKAENGGPKKKAFTVKISTKILSQLAAWKNLTDLESVIF